MRGMNHFYFWSLGHTRGTACARAGVSTAAALHSRVLDAGDAPVEYIVDVQA